jgi:hypothetical protein
MREDQFLQVLLIFVSVPWNLETLASMGKVSNYLSVVLFIPLYFFPALLFQLEFIIKTKF